MAQDLQQAVAAGQEIEWPGTMYKGHNLFKLYHDTSAFIDAFQDMHCDIDSQECYLGYIPTMDMFVSGHDCWYDETQECDECMGTGLEDDDEYESCDWCDGGQVESEAIEQFNGNAFLFTVDDSGKITVVKPVDRYGRMFYSDGMFENVKSLYPDIVHIRLD